MLRACSLAHGRGAQQHGHYQNRRTVFTQAFVYAAGNREKVNFGKSDNGYQTPMKLELPVPMSNVFTGPQSCVGVCESGSAYVWGDQADGKFDAWAVTDLLKPQKLERISKVTSVACGGYHTLFASTNGRVGAISQEKVAHVPAMRFLFSGLKGEVPIKKVFAGVDYSVILTEQGDLYSVGVNSEGQLGRPGVSTNPLDMNMAERVSHELPQDPDFVVACGWGHTLAFSPKHQEVWAWGANKHGQCGNQSTQNAFQVHKISQLSGVPLRSVQCGSTHSAALTRSGDVWVWGSHADGKLGLFGGDRGPAADMHEPTRVVLSLQDGDLATDVALGIDHSVVLTNSGQLWTWGFGQHGVLGHSLWTNCVQPTEVKLPASQETLHTSSTTTTTTNTTSTSFSSEFPSSKAQAVRAGMDFTLALF